MTNEAVSVRGGPVERCEIETPAPFVLVVFGASGDLTQRKIMPAVYRLHLLGLLPGKCLMLGVARTPMGDDEFRERMRLSVKKALPEDYSDERWAEFGGNIIFATVDYSDPAAYRVIDERLAPLERAHGCPGNRIYYLAVPPEASEAIIVNLGQSGLSRERRGFSHVVVEKPFGRDLASATALNETLKKSFAERQIYRIDHYLAKETVQNVLMFRFANSIFEPLWNRNYIDHIQITAAESLGVEHRASYYERAGVIRDMFQNHIFQLLALTAMEPPSMFEAERVRDEKAKVFRSIRPFPLERLGGQVVVGQYVEGTVDGAKAVAYRDEPGVAKGSVTPTYAAMKLYIDNWRWQGVPFFLRSGKRLKRKKAEISVHFREIPHLMFAEAMSERIEPNTLVLRLQPDEGLHLRLQTKLPGSKVCLNPVDLDFTYPRVFMLEAYERVLLDCMQGDQMLFVREDGVREAWAVLTPVIEKIEAEKGRGLAFYPAGSEGPAEADLMMEREGKAWRTM